MTDVDHGSPAQVSLRAGDFVCRGAWRGQGPPPPVGAETDIEVTVEDGCRWSGDNELVGVSAGAEYLSGQVEATEADGVVTLRVGDGLVMVEVPDDGRLPQVGERLTVSDARLTFWPTSV